MLLQLFPKLQPTTNFKAELTETNLRVFYKSAQFFSITTSNPLTKKQVSELLGRYAAMRYLSVSDCCDIMDSLGELYESDD
jgi:hypothetical protein